MITPSEQAGRYNKQIQIYTSIGRLLSICQSINYDACENN